MRLKIDLIVILCSIVLAIVCACLIAVWQGFACLTGLFVCVASAVFSYRRYVKMQIFQRQIDDQKFQDAYIYADENYTDFDPKSFAYSKKQEKQITQKMRSLRSMFYCGIVLVVASIALMIFGILMI